MDRDSVDSERVAGRPRGVTLIAALLIAASGFLSGSAVLISLGRAPLALGAPLLNGLELLGPIAFFGASLLMAGAAYGLLKLRRWSRRAAIAVAAWIIASAIPGVSSAIGIMRPLDIAREGAIVIGGVVVIRYLIVAPTREAFDSARSEATSLLAPKRSSR